MYASGERGAVAVLVAIMMMLIFVCVGLVVDIGHIHNVKVELQRAVDAAALAAAAELPDGSWGPTADTMLRLNHADKNEPGVTTTVTPGSWNPDIVPGQTAAQRFTGGGEPSNAVMVAASRTVKHYFYFFTPDTQITADAIAVAKPINPVMPLALVSCTPASQSVKKPGSLPDMSICGITAFSFNNDQDDTGAWTSLTFNANASEVGEYMLTESGREKFNSVIYGRGLDNDGIENTDVDPAVAPYSKSYPGCQPEGQDIDCGLGAIAGKEIALPSEFPVPAGLPELNKDATTGVYSVTAGFDPLTAYGANGALPRWYNLDPADGLQKNDHFARIWSLDGILLPGNKEAGVGATKEQNFAAYQTRLKSYYDYTVRPFGDDRLADKDDSGNKAGQMITTYSGKTKNEILQQLGISAGSYSSIYWPDFNKVVRHAGYPRVFVFNGVAGTIMAQFFDNPEVTDGTNLLCRDDPGLPSGQYALVLKSPVIFAGSCEAWKAMSQNNAHELFYVGMSKFLVTRAWKNPNGYDCGGNFVNVGGCASGFDPPAGPGGQLSIVPYSSPGAIEGVTLLPVSEEEEEQASLVKILLVE